MSGQIWVQIVLQRLQQTTLVGKELTLKAMLSISNFFFSIPIVTKHVSLWAEHSMDLLSEANKKA